MANYNGDVGSYSHSDYTGLKEVWINKVQMGACVTPVAQFSSRNKILVRAMHVWTRSAASGSAASLTVTRSGVTIASKVGASLNATGIYFCVTCTTLNTLSTITEQVGFQLDTGDKGKWDVMYEYQVLYPSTHIGA